MKNACIVFQSNKSASLENIFSITKAFDGYDFMEIRILYLLEEVRIRQAFSNLKSSEHLLLIFEQAQLPQIKRFLNENYPQGIYQMETDGGLVYQTSQISCFLLYADRLNKSIEYATKVCVPYLQKKSAIRYDKYTIRTVGASEDYIKRLLTESVRMAGENLFYRHHRKFGEDVIDLYYNGNISKMLLDDIIRMFADGLGESIYALEDITLEEQLIRLLKLRGKKLSVAESFTGGGVGNRIVSVSGASEVYFEGLNTYNELSKMKRLNVSKFTLKTKGAVSDQTAYEMASGLIATGDCDISIATTGLAGPKSDKSLLPVGLCYIAIGLKERVFVYRYQFDGSREEITQTAINYAMFLAYKQLKNV